jgi:hypothetical protein
MNEHTKTLEPKIRAIQEQLKQISSEKNTEQLITIIHRPGWTTVREAEFVHAMLDSLAHQVEGVSRAHGALVTVADKIGQE